QGRPTGSRRRRARRVPRRSPPGLRRPCTPPAAPLPRRPTSLSHPAAQAQSAAGAGHGFRNRPRRRSLRRSEEEAGMAEPHDGPLGAVYTARDPAEIAALYDGWAEGYDADMGRSGYRHPAIATALLARWLPR